MRLSNVHGVVCTYHMLVIICWHGLVASLGPVRCGCLLNDWVTDLDVAVISGIGRQLRFSPNWIMEVLLHGCRISALR